jgi:hypothetical protein
VRIILVIMKVKECLGGGGVSSEDGGDGYNSSSCCQALINCPSDLNKNCAELVRTTTVVEDSEEMLETNGAEMTERSYFPSSSSHGGRFSRGLMMLPTLLLVLALSSSLLINETQGLRINSKGGYEDIVVSVGNDVPPITCQQLVQNLQVCLNAFLFLMRNVFLLYLSFLYSNNEDRSSQWQSSYRSLLAAK